MDEIPRLRNIKKVTTETEYAWLENAPPSPTAQQTRPELPEPITVQPGEGPVITTVSVGGSYLPEQAHVVDTNQVSTEQAESVVVDTNQVRTERAKSVEVDTNLIATGQLNKVQVQADECDDVQRPYTHTVKVSWDEDFEPPPGVSVEDASVKGSIANMEGLSYEAVTDYRDNRGRYKGLEELVTTISTIRREMTDLKRRVTTVESCVREVQNEIESFAVYED